MLRKWCQGTNMGGVSRTDVNKGAAMDTTDTPTVTYTIYDYMIPTLQDRVHKVNSRAARQGLSLYTLTYQPTDPEPVYDDELIARWHRNEAGEADFPLDRHGRKLEPFDYRARTTITISGIVPQLPGGWKLIGKVEEDPIAGPMPKLISDEARALNLNLDPYRDDDTWNNCDHCGMRRDRARVYLLRSEAGDITRVGSTCLSAFLGMDVRIPEVSFAIMKDAEDMEADTLNLNWAGGFDDVAYRITDILAIAHATIAEYGWVSSNSARYTPGLDSTGERVSLLVKAKGLAAAVARHEMINSVSADLVAEMVAYARDLRNHSDSEYGRTVSCIVEKGGGLVSGRGLKTIASVVFSYQRAKAQELIASIVIDSDYVGEVKERLTFPRLKVIYSRMVESAYGTSQLVKFVDPTGNVLVWWNSGKASPQLGETYDVTGTVKGHDVRDDIKQTMITRCKLATC